MYKFIFRSSSDRQNKGIRSIGKQFNSRWDINPIHVAVENREVNVETHEKISKDMQCTKYRTLPSAV